MNLIPALSIRAGDVVVFVGAGGKTRTMFRLADELVNAGLRVITTTTTRVAQDELRFAPQRVGFGHGMRPPDSLPEQVERFRHVFVFTKLEADNKVRGVPPAWVDNNLVPSAFFDVLLVEGDGSRRLPMKAPLPHEPVIPGSTTVVVPVVGMDALGQPLDDEHVYGTEFITRLTGCLPGEMVTTRLMAAVLMHPQLGLKNIPRGARILPLLNKTEPQTLLAAREVAGYLLTDLNIERVLIGAVLNTDPIREVRRRVGAVILAAGESRRMGQPKLLLPWADTTIIRQVCQQVLGQDLYDVVVVVGGMKDQIQIQLADLPLRLVYNSEYAQGEMLSSLKIGLQALWHTCDACLVVLGDQPTIERSVIAALLQAYAEGRGRLIAPAYLGRRGHPLLIDRDFWQAIINLPVGAAPRDVLQANRDEIYYLSVDTDSILRDIDTPDDYAEALRRLG